MTKGKDADPSDNYLTPGSTSENENINGNPTNLTLTEQEESIDLAWTNGSTNEDGIIIERGLDGESFAGLDVLSNGTVGYSDTATEQEIEYYYKIRAFNGHSYSQYSNTVQGTLLNPSLPEGALTFEGDTDLLTFEGDTENIVFELELT
jgi:hypothetical protein